MAMPQTCRTWPCAIMRISDIKRGEFVHMSYSTDWLIKPYVYRVEYQDEYTLADGEAVRQTIVPLLDHNMVVLHFIFDMQQVTWIEPSLKEIQRNQNAASFYQHPLLGWILYVIQDDNPLIQFVTSAIAQRYDARVRWFNTQDEALDFLREIGTNI